MNPFDHKMKKINLMIIKSELKRACHRKNHRFRLFCFQTWQQLLSSNLDTIDDVY